MNIQKALFFVAALLLLSACGNEKRYRVPGKPEHSMVFTRYEQDFFEDGRIEDSVFSDLFSNQIMQFGSVGEARTDSFLELFRLDSTMQKVYADCQALFPNLEIYQKQLSEAFHRLRHFVPDMPLPAVSTHISGFSQSVVSAPSILSVSLDKYLGSDYPMYQSLFYDYQRQRMRAEQLVPDCLNGWLRSEFTNASIMEDSRLLDFIVYEGKMLFVLKLLFPEAEIEYLTGWTKKQADWCAANEKRMWERILEYEHLYSRDHLVLSKYIGDGPATVYFTRESPSRAVLWTGLKMVEAYMQQHKDLSVISLLMETNADNILNESLYRPE
ncbi:MAG: hypothetical protein GX841_00495 [Bacteroidales bacterium]|nr:hypothetical protein [Bacteroidales bacterium]